MLSPGSRLATLQQAVQKCDEAHEKGITKTVALLACPDTHVSEYAWRSTTIKNTLQSRWCQVFWRRLPPYRKPQCRVQRTAA